MRAKVALIVSVLVLSLVAGLASEARAQRAAVSSAEVNGTFLMKFTGRFKGSANEIKLLALGKGKVRVAMDLLYPYVVNGELSANMGELDGEANIARDVAVYESDEFGPCKITIKFVRPGTIKVTQAGSDFDCGFGHNVVATGTYIKSSAVKPSFERNN